MTTLRRFACDDLFRFASTNLDPLTETYNPAFYLNYFARFPDLCMAQESPSGRLMGYILAKAEGKDRNWHGHISAVTVSPEFRRLGAARTCVDAAERVSQHTYNAWFVDLFVRVSNLVAIQMYRAFGYVVYRRVLSYYGGEEDAFDMRRACARDTAKESIIPARAPVKPDQLWPD